MNKSEMLEKFLWNCSNQRNLDFKTVKAYRIDMNQFFAFCEQPNEITKYDLKDYISYLNSSYKPRTVKRKIASLKVFCNFLYDEEIIKDNPFLGLRIKLPPPKTLPRTISIRVIESLLQEAHLRITSSKTEYERICALREAAVMETLFATGIRVSELCGLTISDVDLIEGLIRIQGKGKKERIVAIENEEVLKTLCLYRAGERITDQAHFFLNSRGRQLTDQSVRLVLKKYESITNAPVHITPHMFRHSFATMLLDADVDLRYIQHLLGHSSTSTTQIYTQVSSAKLKSILAAKHPRNSITINE